ncbi:MAG: glycosyltransferase, partial [Allobaculum sp.]|nr:glycosyltransferase [Allobaculum sp.]
MISVCIATYNGERYIETQIRSILDQLNEDDEIIISDDSSTDRTLDIIRSLNDSRIKLFAGNKFHSRTFNFENALKQATGDFIFLSDQDDIWL